MLLTINPKTHFKEWVFYAFHNTKSHMCGVGMCRYSELTDVKMPQNEETVYLTVIDKDTDRYKLANRANAWLGKNEMGVQQWQLREVVLSWNRKKRGNTVRCVETGEEWDSISDCSEKQNVSYTQLHKHIKGAVGYRSVKGKTYKLVDNNN